MRALLLIGIVALCAACGTTAVAAPPPTATIAPFRGYVDARLIAASPAGWAGENVLVYATVQVIRPLEGGVALLVTAGPLGAQVPLAVEARPGNPGVRVGECWSVYGVVDGARIDGAPLVRAYELTPCPKP